MRTLFSFAVAILVAAPLRAAETPAQEIEFLLEHIHNSKVRFVRSGKEYSGQEGAEHLRKKLARAGKRVKTAEDFINGIASKSSFTGQVYMVKFPDGKMAPTGPWLTAALAKHRLAATPK